MIRKLTNRRMEAFTLIEVILAIIAISLVLAVAQGLFTNAAHLRDRSSQHVREARERSRVASIIRNDLRNALVSGGVLASSLMSSEQNNSSSFPGYLKFTTTGASPSMPTASSPEIQEVQYYILDDPSNKEHTGGLLVRTVDKNLLAPIRNADESASLLSHVKSITTTFFDGTNWVNAWDNSTDESLLPVAVNVRIEQAPVIAKEEPPPLDILVLWNTQPFTDTSGTNNAISSFSMPLRSNLSPGPDVSPFSSGGKSL